MRPRNSSWIDLTRKLEEQQRFGELVELYDEWGQPEKAAAYRDRAAEPQDVTASD